jgi:hypothetical protein
VSVPGCRGRWPPASAHEMRHCAVVILSAAALRQAAILEITKFRLSP